MAVSGWVFEPMRPPSNRKFFLPQHQTKTNLIRLEQSSLHLHSPRVVHTLHSFCQSLYQACCTFASIIMATSKAPVDFTTSDDGPDCRLQVFDQIFYVDSLILKTHSGFFRMFFDSPDKTLSTFRGPYKYMWVTRVDDDGRGWNLVAGDNENVSLANRIKSNVRTCPTDDQFLGRHPKHQHRKL